MSVPALQGCATAVLCVSIDAYGGLDRIMVLLVMGALLTTVKSKKAPTSADLVPGISKEQT